MGAEGNLVAGIDLGGTKVLTILADEQGRVLARVQVPTLARRGREDVLARLAKTLFTVLGQAGARLEMVRGVGLGVPGPVDDQKGLLHHAPNLDWREVPLAEIMHRRLGCPVYLDNDANLAALGEYCYGAGRGLAPLVYITVSTGIGGGLVLDGDIYHGACGGAGEIGHITVAQDGPLCRCGNRGCLETLASGTALARQAHDLLEQGKGAGILAAAAGQRERITARAIARAAAAGDHEAALLLERGGRYLGIALAGLINVLNPRAVVLGGGLMQAKDYLWPAMLEQAQRRSFASSYRAARIIPAALDRESGARGAVALALTRGGQG